MDALADILWRDHRTVLVHGPVSKAAWLPGQEGAWVLVAADDLQARDALGKITRLKEIWGAGQGCQAVG